MDDLISIQEAIDALGERPVVWNEWVDEYELGQRNQYDSDRLAIETILSPQPEDYTELKRSVKAANLDEFWHGQPYIEALDPNFFACRDWEDLAGQLIESKAWVNFNQGVDARVMTAEKIEAIRRMKMRAIHFAWDRYEDKDKVLPKLQMFREITGWDHNRVRVYVLTNFNTTIEQDLERIYTLRDLDCDPYVMIFDKGNTRNWDDVRRLQRWVNNKYVWRKCKTFEEYTR